MIYHSHLYFSLINYARVGVPDGRLSLLQDLSEPVMRRMWILSLPEAGVLHFTTDDKVP